MKQFNSNKFKHLESTKWIHTYRTYRTNFYTKTGKISTENQNKILINLFSELLHQSSLVFSSSLQAIVYAYNYRVIIPPIQFIISIQVNRVLACIYTGVGKSLSTSVSPSTCIHHYDPVKREMGGEREAYSSKLLFIYSCIDIWINSINTSIAMMTKNMLPIRKREGRERNGGKRHADFLHYITNLISPAIHREATSNLSHYSYSPPHPRAMSNCKMTSKTHREIKMYVFIVISYLTSWPIKKITQALIQPKTTVLAILSNHDSAPHLTCT